VGGSERSGPVKFYVYAIVDTSNPPGLFDVRLTRKAAREYIAAHGALLRDAEDPPVALRVRRAKLTLFDS
jgi:hypothetical protein